MLAAIDAETIRIGLIQFLILVASLSVHEWAHAWTAMKIGDPTAQMQGRVTLNPIAHIDPIGTVMLPLLMFFVNAAGGGFGMIGWAKPVPVNPANFGHKVRDDLLVTLAGPFSNLVLCCIAAVIARLVLPQAPQLEELFFRFIFLNALLATFNMVIAVPPLDGSRVLRHVLGMSEETYLEIARYGFLIVVVLLNIPLVSAFLTRATVFVTLPFLRIGGIFQHLWSGGV